MSSLPVNTVRNIVSHFSVGQALPIWLQKQPASNEISSVECAALFKKCLFKSHRILKQYKKAQKQKNAKIRHQKNVKQRQLHMVRQKQISRTSKTSTSQMQRPLSTPVLRLRKLSHAVYAQRDRFLSECNKRALLGEGMVLKRYPFFIASQQKANSFSNQFHQSGNVTYY